MVKQALEECNRLNYDMAEFTPLLKAVAPPPEGAVRL
jgi:hypothetical protein